MLLTTKTGSLWGVALGLVTIGVAVTLNPELKELPLEDIVSSSGKTAGLFMALGAARGYADELSNKYGNQVINYVTSLIHAYSNNK